MTGHKKYIQFSGNMVMSPQLGLKLGRYNKTKLIYLARF